jgi:hypothetical protein
MMKLFTAAFALGVTLPALATEPVELSSAQMDQITAAGNTLQIRMTGDYDATGGFTFINQDGAFSYGSVGMTVIPYGATTLDIELTSSVGEG